MTAEARTSSLTEGAVGRTLVVFSLPILASNVLQSLNGSINAMWVGHYLGGAALTATSNANLIMFFLIGMVLGVGMATGILVGQSVGAKDLDMARRVVGTSATFFALMALVVSVVGFFLSPQLLVWMRTPADAMPFAVAYLRLIFVAMPFAFGSAFLMMVLRGAGDSRTPMLFSLLAVVVDIALNPVLMFGWGPAPRMGIAGSAAATVAANAVGMGAMLAHLYARKHFLRIGRDEIGYLRLDRAILASLLRKGLPMGMQMIVLSSSGILMISLVNRYGTATTAAYGATMQLWNYIQMPAVAIGMAASSMAAQNVGAGRWDRVGSVATAGVVCNCLMTGTLAVVIYLLDEQALGLFLNEPEAIAIGVHLNAIGVWSFLFFGVSMVLSGVVRATGAVLPPLAILAVALLGLRLPFALALQGRWHEDAIWWSFPVGAFAAMAMSAAYYRLGGWRRARMLESTAARPASSAAV